MNHTIRLGLAAILAAASPAAQGAGSERIATVVADSDRSTPDTRPVQVFVPQRNIATTFDLGRIAEAANGGGLLGYLIIRDLDDRRERLAATARERAEAAAAPLRRVLSDFDVDALALETSKRALAAPDWFHARDFTFVKGPGNDRVAFMVSSLASQYAFVRYNYELSPDSSQIRVIAEISLVERQAARGKAPAPPPRTIYQQQWLSVVQLRMRSYEPRENIARWCADDGRRARIALTSAFARLEQLIPYGLAMRADDAAALSAKKHEKAYAAGFYGSLIRHDEHDPDDLLIWSDRLIQVQAIS